jgi:hypothetical protein
MLKAGSQDRWFPFSLGTGSPSLSSSSAVNFSISLRSDCEAVVWRPKAVMDIAYYISRELQIS